jgi:hypothetical protein
LVDDGGDNLLLLLLLLSHDQERISLSALGAKVASIGQQVCEVDNLLVNQHTGDSAGKVETEVLFDDGINGVTNEVLSLFRVCDLIKIIDVDLRKRKGRKLRRLLVPPWW